MSRIRFPILAAALYIGLGAVTLGAFTPVTAQARDWDRGRNSDWHHGHDRRDRYDDHQWDNKGGWTRQTSYDRVRNFGRPVYVQPRVFYRPAPVYYQPVYRPRYRVGEHCNDYRPVPRHVLMNLQPAPYGYYYTAYDRDVYLVRNSDNAIVQILSLLLN